MGISRKSGSRVKEDCHDQKWAARLLEDRKQFGVEVRNFDRDHDIVALRRCQRDHLAGKREVRTVGVHLRKLFGSPPLLCDGRHQTIDVLDELSQLDQPVVVGIAVRQRI